MTNIKFSIGTVINSNYWRIEGIKNLYDVFQKEVSEKFNKDLSEYKIEEEVEKPEVDIDLDLDIFEFPIRYEIKTINKCEDKFGEKWEIIVNYYK